MAAQKNLKLEINSDANEFISFKMEGYGFKDKNDLSKLLMAVLPISTEDANNLIEK